MAEMQAFLNKRQEEDEILRNEIDDLLTALNKLVQLIFILFIINLVGFVLAHLA